MKELLEFLRSAEGKTAMATVGVWLTALVAKYGATVSREIGLMVDRSVEIGYYAAEQARKVNPNLTAFELKEAAVTAAEKSLPFLLQVFITKAHIAHAIEGYVGKVNATPKQGVACPAPTENGKS